MELDLVAIMTDVHYNEVGIIRRIPLYVSRNSPKHSILRAIEENDYSCFINTYAQLSEIERQDTYPLSHAALHGRREMFFYLHNQGYRPNDRTLEYAKKGHNKIIIKYLSKTR